MNKTLSLSFALAAMICLIAAGASLSYFQSGWALFFFVLSFVVTGCGMFVKRRLQRNRHS